MHVYYYLPISEQIEMLLKKKILPTQLYENQNENLILDIKDGTIYKKFIKNFKNPANINSFMLNTDGISICDKSNLSIWPVYLAINELDIGKRFCINNIIIAGICVGHKKPSFSHFFEPIKKQLLDLEIGFNIDNRWFQFFLLFGIYDKPARSSMLNINGSTGYYSCCKCYQKGESVAYCNGHHVIFPYDPDINLRDLDNYQIDLHRIQNGIKGQAIFNNLTYYDPILSTNVDIMHSIFLG